MSKRTKAEEQERTESLAKLHEILKPGSTVHCEVLHVAKSGMSRHITCLAVDPRDNEIVRLDYWIARVLGYRTAPHGGLVVGGCGMDMCFSVVYNLGSAMWPDGTPEPHGRRNGEPDRAGGYALKHR